MSAAAVVRTWYLPVYAVIVVASALLHTRSLTAGAAELGARPSFLEAVLNVSGDSYVLIPWMLMAWILSVAAHLAESTDPLVLLRHGSRLRWMLARGSTFLRDAVLIVGTTVAAAAVTAPGLPLTTQWTRAPWGAIDNALLEAWTSSGLPPLIALSAQSVLTLSGLLAISTVASAVAMATSRHRPLSLLLVLSASFLVPLLLVRLPAAGALESLVVLARRGFPGWPLTPILLLTAVSIGTLALVGLIEQRRLPRRSASAASGIYALLVAALLTAATLGSGASTFAELLIALFYGSGEMDFRLTTYTFSMLIFLGPAYLVLLSVFDSDLPQLPQLALRHGRIWPWLRRIALRILLAGILLVLVLALATFLLAALTGRDLSPGPTGAVWHQFLVNGALQVYVSGMAVVLVALLTGSDLAGVWTLLALIVLGIPPITHGYFPSGLHMLGLLQNGTSPWQGTVILVISTALISMTAYLISTRPASQRLITGRTLAHR
ncbi:MAG: hypothetical protein ACTHV2_13665 [Brachybacterium sp.]|uniref:hypothetical protein n=1 Tax=Brachybacterium sp. TaxID=1891286 RepID=UPI00264D9AE1|nr:hypothetical protein [Brachybacterium sp.]MDN6329847.1 hypothetical protein [Brachybacterium sp.]MDN6399936.1 hypothetical protein [Brachybacterium sp.]